ncbi:hypothetical protein BYT27DRAFT_7305745 [Phlegmacium glaucopus]|nr:hypothetical protein BYT27DRAFT_7305745 [Phlegmacium glaucopus]
MTADEEKAALRRYEEAKRAVDRTQLSEYSSDLSPVASAPIAYESLFPAASTSGPGTTDEPPLSIPQRFRNHICQRRSV